jgi:hypothetical protein
VSDELVDQAYALSEHLFALADTPSRYNADRIHRAYVQAVMRALRRLEKQRTPTEANHHTT